MSSSLFPQHHSIDVTSSFHHTWSTYASFSTIVSFSRIIIMPVCGGVKGESTYRLHATTTLTFRRTLDLQFSYNYKSIQASTMLIFKTLAVSAMATLSPLGGYVGPGLVAVTAAVTEDWKDGGSVSTIFANLIQFMKPS